MFTGPVGPVEVFFYWPETVFGNFYWPGAIGSPLASSPALSMTGLIDTFLEGVGSYMPGCMLFIYKYDILGGCTQGITSPREDFRSRA